MEGANTNIGCVVDDDEAQEWKGMTCAAIAHPLVELSETVSGQSVLKAM